MNFLLAGSHPTQGGLAATYLIASQVLYGVAFTMNTGFLGAGWADFGYVGVAESALILFGVLLAWDIALFRRANANVLLVLTAYFVGKLWNILNWDLFTMLVLGGLVFVPLLCLLLYPAPSRSFQERISRPLWGRTRIHGSLAERKVLAGVRLPLLAKARLAPPKGQ